MSIEFEFIKKKKKKKHEVCTLLKCKFENIAHGDPYEFQALKVQQRYKKMAF